MSKTKTNAIDVARYLIRLAAAEDEPECLSPMRLQKLLYYVQAWSLVRRDAPMFSEKLQAWAHGPVVDDVYQEFKRHGKAAIPVDEGSKDNLSDEERAFIKKVWNVYKPYSAISLSQMTHAESPWLEARGDLAPAATSKREVTHKSMVSYFSSLKKK